MNSRIAPGPAAFGLMVLLCACWGMQQVAIKIAGAEISPILQAGLRSAGAALLVFVFLLYQLMVSAVMMFPLSWLVGEKGIAVLSAPTFWAMAYQIVIVAFASYLAWFWLLTRYLAGRLLVFSFLTPLFGVAFGMVLMGDQPSVHFAVAAAMVVGGIVLVNMPARK